MHVAAASLKVETLFVVHPGNDGYRMGDKMEAVPMAQLGERLVQAEIVSH